MLKQFYPGRCAASAYGLPYGDFYSRGIRGVIFDIDNTLVPHGAPADDRARALFKELQEMGMNTCLMSNNKEPRVASFAGEVGSGYLFKAGKPRRRGYEEAMKQISRGGRRGRPRSLWAIRFLRTFTAQTAPELSPFW